MLHNRVPDFRYLRVFGCLCYPNLLATAPHKLSARSVACAFLGYPDERKGYRCYDPISHRIIFSRHVTFVESIFPFKTVPDSSPAEPDSTPDAPPIDHIDHGAWHQHHPSLPACTPPGSPPDPSTSPSSGPSGHGPRSPSSTDAPSSSCSASPPTVPSPPPRHPMITRARHGISKPNPRYANLAETAISPLLTSVREALRDPHWRAAMQDEYDALMSNSTWHLVPYPPLPALTWSPESGF